MADKLILIFVSLLLVLPIVFSDLGLNILYPTPGSYNSTNTNILYTLNTTSLYKVLWTPNNFVTNYSLYNELPYHNTSKNGTYCYQESANVSTACGGLATGSYRTSGFYYGTNFSLAVDGNWNTATNQTTIGDASYLDIMIVNYTKPTLATGAIWQVKDLDGIKNITIPSSCWNAFADKIRLAAGIEKLGVYKTTSWYCFTGSGDYDFISINLSYYTSNHYVYEEAVWWNIQNNSVVDYYKPGLVWSNSFAYWGNNSNATANISLFNEVNVSSRGIAYNGVIFNDSGANFNGTYRYITVQDINKSLTSEAISWGAKVNIINKFIDYNTIIANTHSSLDSIGSIYSAWAIGTTDDTNNIYCTLSNTTGERQTSVYTLQNNTNYYIWCDYNTSHLSMYINGNIYSSVSFVGTRYKNFSNVTIGAWNENRAVVQGTMNGSISEVKIYNRSLSAEEIKILYNEYNLTNITNQNWNIGRNNVTIYMQQDNGDSEQENVTFNKYNYTLASPSNMLSGINQNFNILLFHNISSLNFNDINATFDFGGQGYSVTKNTALTNMTFSVSGISYNTSTSVNIPYNWNFSFINDGTINHSFTQPVYVINISNCITQPTWINIMNITFYDEETLNVSQPTDLNMQVLYNDTIYGLSFTGRNNYSVCIHPNSTNITIDAIMEYYKEDVYSNRKYYLNDYNIDNVSNTLNLYNINETVSSDVILTVYDKSTGQVIPEAYIKILRYYPQGEISSQYQTVEIEKTDVQGQTGAKLVLADVWYKFIIEDRNGDILLNSDIEKILTTDKLIGISSESTLLLDYNALLDIYKDVSCDKSTKICRFTWSNPTNVPITGELKIFRDNGFRKDLVYSNSVISAAATIAYQVTGNITQYAYSAEGWITQ